MRQSRYLVNTLRETPAEAEVISHQLMLRAGMIRKLASGIYNYLPLGLRVIRRIERIIREEMNAAGAQELLMPAVVPAELWMESGRWPVYGKELLRLKDRHDREFCIGPTHEEVITAIARAEVKSYRQLPVNLYQIQTKFRDEVRPRFGLMRGREFIMKDAYSFHASVEDALKEYDNMYAAYKRIFTRCGLEYRPVEADSGAIGGNKTHEFQVLASSGEDEILSCDACEYAANVEKAGIGHWHLPPVPQEAPAMIETATPGKKGIEEVADFLQVTPQQTLRAGVFKAVRHARGENRPEEFKLVLAFTRGDRNFNEIKIKTEIAQAGFTADALELLPENDPVGDDIPGFPGFVGPLGAADHADFVFLDRSIITGMPYVTGAGRPDHHFRHAVAGRDFRVTPHAEISRACAGDACPRCEKGHLQSHRGIEVGQVFLLGTKYSDAMHAVYQDEDGTEKPMVMGCYGIGVGRTAAASIEQNHDDKGIIWPEPIAPFDIHMVALTYKDATVAAAADAAYARLQAAGLEVLFDDRDESAGVKFNDADLIGIPWRVILGKKNAAEGKFELKSRRTGTSTVHPLADLEAVLANRGR